MNTPPDSYDLIAYPTMPLPRSHPNHLGALGQLMGLHPVPTHGCRVLELGCAHGGNLLPMAARLPASRFVGVERSTVQARQAQEASRQLGLTNVTILAMDLLAFEDDEPFDYILAHGIYSWAPAPVREGILTLCHRLLAPHGLALVSFNSLPGWHLRGMLREMVLEHTRAGDTPVQRLELARGFLERWLPAMAESDAPAARHLTVEITRLLKAHPAYLYHEYLAAENQPLLFRTFVEQAASHGLRHVCDADPACWWPASLGPQAQALLSATPPGLAWEQMLDTLLLRHFREAVLCRQETPVLATWDMDRLTSLAAFAMLQPPPRLLLHQNQAQPFYNSAGLKIPVSHPLTRAALALLWERSPAAMAWPQLGEEAAEMAHAGGAGSRAMESDHLAGELFSLFLRGEVGLCQTPEPPLPPLAEAPRPSPLATLWLQEGWLPGRRHAPLQLDPAEIRLFQLLDGQNDLEALTLAMLGPDAPPDAGKLQSRLRRLRPWVLERLELWHRMGVLAESPVQGTRGPPSCG